MPMRVEALGVVARNSTVESGERCDLAGNLNLNMNESEEEEEELEVEEQSREWAGFELKRVVEVILIIL